MTSSYQWKHIKEQADLLVFKKNLVKTWSKMPLRLGREPSSRGLEYSLLTNSTGKQLLKKVLDQQACLPSQCWCWCLKEMFSSNPFMFCTHSSCLKLKFWACKNPNFFCKAQNKAQFIGLKQSSLA